MTDLVTMIAVTALIPAAFGWVAWVTKKIGRAHV